MGEYLKNMRKGKKKKGLRNERGIHFLENGRMGNSEFQFPPLLPPHLFITNHSNLESETAPETLI